MSRAMRHDGTDAGDAGAMIREISGCTQSVMSAYNDGPDMLVWGETRGLVKKALAVLGFGIEGEERGPFRQADVRDATGRLWGTIGTCPDTGRTSTRLCYILARR